MLNQGFLWRGEGRIGRSFRIGKKPQTLGGIGPMAILTCRPVRLWFRNPTQSMQDLAS